MYSIFDIANWFLQKGEPIDHIKLQKLCYYAQAWYLALNSERLFKENFEGWSGGPVCREIWYSIKSHKDVPVSKEEFEQKSNVISNINGDVNFLNEIWETYGKYSGNFLSEQTHKELPWINARKGLSKYQAGNRIITDNDMKTYYSDKNLGDGIDEITSCLKIDNIYSKENQKHLKNAIKELKEGKFEEHELIEVDRY